MQPNFSPHPPDRIIPRLLATFFLTICILSPIIHFGGVSSDEIDNGIVGIPLVQCLQQRITVTFHTQRPFLGRIYVRGQRQKPGCHVDHLLAPIESPFRFSVEIDEDGGECEVVGQPISGEWTGVAYSAVIILSFHDTFVTKVDRAFRATCFHSNIHRLSNRLQLNNLDIQDVTNRPSTPECRYDIRADTPDGPVIRYSAVGQKIYHVWTCDGPGTRNRGFLVRSCFATDDKGQRIALYDRRGCAIDPIVMGDIRYSGTFTRAFVQVHSFKFSDIHRLQLECMLEFCSRANAECMGLVPPRCSNLYKRSATTNTKIDGDRQIIELLSNKNSAANTTMKNATALNDDLDSDLDSLTVVRNEHRVIEVFPIIEESMSPPLQHFSNDKKPSDDSWQWEGGDSFEPIQNVINSLNHDLISNYQLRRPPWLKKKSGPGRMHCTRLSPIAFSLIMIAFTFFLIAVNAVFIILLRRKMRSSASTSSSHQS